MRAPGFFRLSLLVTFLAVGSSSTVASAEVYWVFLADKAALAGDSVPWTASPSKKIQDLPVTADYVKGLAQFGTIRTCSRWLNAVSLELPKGRGPGALSQLPFATAVIPVRAARRGVPSGAEPAARRSAPNQDYGPSFEQLNLLAVPLLHARGLRGAGVRIAIMDTGFNWPDYRAFAHLNVIAARDFINDDDDVTDQSGQPVTGNEPAFGQGQHGTRVLGLVAGNDPGQLVGVAPDAEYLLAKVEDLTRELPIEEDRWVAGLEWADSMGAQVLNSSLGYTEWDDGTGYTYGDLDGRTTLSAQVAQVAVERGMVVVASAGNEGNKSWVYITTPADAPGVMTVGAVHVQSAAIASFSSRGPTADGRIKPDVVAPGQFVYSVEGSRVAAPGNFDADQYVRFSGTSAASPLIAGVAALMLQADPNLTPPQINERLRSTVTDLGPVGPDTIFGYGLVNAAAAVGLSPEIPDQVSTLRPFPNPAVGDRPVVHFPFQLTDTDQVGLAVFDAGGLLVDEIVPQRWPVGVHSQAGQALAWRVPAKLASGLYHYRLTSSVFDATGTVAVIRD
ncbi:MAG: S8 family serine peptidase [Gemmatimonadetes bacterium]|nr:S8 family serine peptidase [Gemmatimonadota bacterium]